MHPTGNMIRGLLIELRDRWMFADNRLAGRQKWRVTTAGDRGRLNPFFVIGHPRSGTTLVRAILSRHRNLFIPPENGNLWRMIRVFGGLRSSSWDTVVSAVLAEFKQGYEFSSWDLELDALYSEALALAPERRNLADLIGLIYLRYGSEHAPGKQIWGDKTSPGSFDHLSKLSLVFPDAAYLHVVRDGRDCVASGVKAGFYNRNYAEAARAWRDNVRACRRFGHRLRNSGRYLELRYEDLVAEPERKIPKICDFIGITADPGMFEHYSGIGMQIPDIKAIAHHKNITKPIFRGSVGKWKMEIPDAEQPGIIDIVLPELKRYGYQ